MWITSFYQKGAEVLYRYRQMVNDLYNEPDEPIIVGSVENNSLDSVDWRMRVSVTKKKKEKKKEGGGGGGGGGK